MGLDSTYLQLAFGLILVSLILLRSVKSSKLNEPPLVPYRYPIIGHTIDYYLDNKNFVEKCQEEYGEIFSLYVFGKIITFVGKELSPEVFRNHKDFNFGAANRETFPMEEFMHRSDGSFNMVSKVVQVNLSGGMKFYTERVQRQLIKSIDEIIGNGKVLKPPIKSIQLIVAKPIAATLVGEELSDDRDLVNSFAHITSDFSPYLLSPPILGFIHPTLHQKFLIILFKFLNGPYTAHRELIKKKIVPVIEKRLGEMKKLGDNYDPPTDILQRYIETFHKDYTVDLDVVIDHMIVTIFASIHTTSLFLTFCLHEYVNNPQFHKELLEEQDQLHKSNENSYYSIEQVAKMEKLDSFVRETMRVSTPNVALPHKMISPYYTFSNGYQVPRDRFVYIRMGEIHYDKELQGQNPNEFDPSRHLERNSPATRVEKNYLIFGLGKHACPGRHFAINEIKVALNYLLLKYDIRKDNNEKNDSKYVGAMKSLDEEGLIFEKKSIN